MPNRAKVVVAYLDGRRLRGYTNDFSPVRDQFFLFPDGVESKPGDRGTPVRIAELKALFFVKDFAGNAAHTEGAGTAQLPGRRVEVIFSDGEKLIGSSVAYNPRNQGFFMQPADPTDNNERIFVVNRNVKQAKPI
ncbi:MAG: hypothetical protein LAO23_19040 [Acidobacteriia bacterium]|nr:hypothetical protein [Terriglobia bacterium]